MTGRMSSLEFRFCETATEIALELEQRLPKSANVYNMVKVYDNFIKPEEMAFYVLCSEREPIQWKSSWILAKYFREDYGNRYAISAPENATITPEIKAAFIECPLIHWNEGYQFACTDSAISPMIWEISTQNFSNSVTSMPCKIFMMKREDAAQLNILEHGDTVLQPMDPVQGTKFICETWKYSIPGKTSKAVEKMIRKNKSSGLYQDGKLICGMLLNDCGLMGMLYTPEEHRGKGYATLVTKTLMKTLAVELGTLPCCAVETRNTNSVAFHEKLGMYCNHHADFIGYSPKTWD